MRLSRAPDLGSPGRLTAAAACATLVVAAILAVRDGPHLTLTLGDTDDAMRLVLVRALASGQGWFDQNVTRLQPPHGVYMHWSRLVDGGIAALNGLFRLGLPPALAELATRFTWPLLWILPACLASLAVARRLGGRLRGAAVFACAILLVTNIGLYLQFRPGRIDHHDVQIVLCLAALAGAAMGRVRGAILSGAATGLGLAIGLEALLFEVAIAAYFPLRFLLAPALLRSSRMAEAGEDTLDLDGRELAAFAAALGLATVVFYLAQTPPWRWAVPACDALGENLTAAVAAGAAGLVLAVRAAARLGWKARLAALAGLGVVVLALYLWLDPNCRNGPFADVDARLKLFWLPNVQEIRPISRLWPRDHDTVYGLVAPALIGALAWLWLGRAAGPRRDPFWILSGVCLVLGTLATFSAIRMGSYANWFAVPIIAAAVVDLVERYFGGVMLATAAGACLATPVLAGGAAAKVNDEMNAMAKARTLARTAPANAVGAKPAPTRQAKAAPSAGDRCFQTAPYAALARQPAGLVLSEVDLGPFILAHSPSSAMAAPYHRMSWGLVTARGVLSTEAKAAEAGARRIGASYVLECPGHAKNADRVGMSAGSLQKRLDAGEPPAWLTFVADTGPLRLYRLRPLAAPQPAAASQAGPGAPRPAPQTRGG